MIPMLQQSNVRVHVFRLSPHQDLKGSILDFAKSRKISAGIILTCVGSLEKIHLRFANQKSGTKRTEYFEIVSLTGTISQSYGHLHIALSDERGNTIGGHLLDENLVYTTAEIAIAELPGVAFDRETDPAYGYHELVVKSRVFE